MKDRAAIQPPPIIKRPRLTKILDDADTPVRMLIAPAGYGKTTLALEWSEQGGRQIAWYTGGTATADVAAMCVGIAEACRPIVPGAGERMHQRLRVTPIPEREVDVLARMLADDLADWPENAWLVFDDYHCAAEAEAPESSSASCSSRRGCRC